MTERETPALTFVRGNDQIDRLTADPLLAADIETADSGPDLRDEPRHDPPTALMTQVAVACKLGVG